MAEAILGELLRYNHLLWRIAIGICGLLAPGSEVEIDRMHTPADGFNLTNHYMASHYDLIAIILALISPKHMAIALLKYTTPEYSGI